MTKPAAHFAKHLFGAVAAFGLTAAPSIAQEQAYAYRTGPFAATQTMRAADMAQAMANAIPMEQLAPNFEVNLTPAALPQPMAMTSPAETRVSPGQRGRYERFRLDERQMDLQETLQTLRSLDRSTSPMNYGLNNLNTIYHYNDYLDRPYPWRLYPMRAIGKLLFTFDGTSWYSCTASLINHAIILTAGHCLHQGGNGAAGWITQGFFYPGYSGSAGDTNNQIYGRCRLTGDLVTTNGWYNEGLITPQGGNGYDVALALCHETWGARRRDANSFFPGTYHGFLGFCYSNCLWQYNFLTQVGYPGNYYNGQEMTISQHVEESALSQTADYIYGTGMRGGSSGGPHIANIGEISDGTTDTGQYTERNIVYAVTSWGYTSDVWKLQGSTPLSGPNNANNFVGMYNFMCGRSRTVHAPWTCRNDLVP